ncbi:kinase-like domain-containing protein [Lentinula edodes]|nr:kinase-like domain-containing protein [Lentinula edodes]
MLNLLKSFFSLVSILLWRVLRIRKPPLILQEVTFGSEWSESSWLTLRDFFQSEGYTYWNKTRPALFQPPNDKARAPNGFAYDDTLGSIGQHYFSSHLNKHRPARTPDCQDVLLVLLSSTEIEILRQVAVDETSFVDQNHTLPLLRTITFDHLTFGVFPLVGLDFTYPWFASMDDTFDAISQILEGVAFLHDNLIAHRDLFIGNILPSHRASRNRNPNFSFTRYYFIDFEHAIHFSKDTDPADRTVIGPPVPFARYGRPIPPEMRQESPHCPFKADIWQVGGCLYQLVLKDAEPYIPEIVELFRATMADKPECRPSICEILETYQRLLKKVPHEVKQMVFDIFIVEHGKIPIESFEEK